MWPGLHKYSAIVFDVDGVLIDDSAGTYGQCKQKVAGFFENEWELCVTGKQDTRVALAKYLGGVAEAIDYQNRWFAFESVLNQPMIEWIKTLTSSSLILAAGTNQDKYRAHYLLEELNFSHYFGERFFASGFMGYRKPSEEFYNYIQNSLQVAPEKILFIDDKIENIEAASKLGWGVHHFTDFETLKASLS